MNLKIHIKENKIIEREFLLDSLNSLMDGTYDISITKAVSGQAKYFFYRDIIADYLGYDKNELHELIKQRLLPEIYKDPDNLNTEDYEKIKSYSTKWLSGKGWVKYNQSLEIFAASNFGVILK